ncbi:MAG: hypothetical protein EBR30_12570 [Cytophagia bacterium]|nr:hypothetical protein [Cytophagia bacterium]NBW35829.1 hypothetical protein [Cytophagia bacterium]
MANRIIVATLYQTPGSSPTYLLNISPNTLETFTSGDQIFLTVNVDSSAISPGVTAISSCKITWEQGSANPFVAGPNTPNVKAINTPTLLGTLNVAQGARVRYSLSIQYNNNTYTEDPEMEINS